MIEEYSAGVVAAFVTGTGSPEYLVLLSNLTRHPYWEFPKGAVEPNESVENAALREFAEETGINDCVLVDGFRRDLQYVYSRRGKLVRKSVTYFLGTVKSKDVKISYEAKDFAWHRIEELLQKLKHKNLKELAREADQYLNENSAS